MQLKETERKYCEKEQAWVCTISHTLYTNLANNMSFFLHIFTVAKNLHQQECRYTSRKTASTGTARVKENLDDLSTLDWLYKLPFSDLKNQ